MARAQDTIFREIGNFSVVNGQLLSIDLPRDLDYARIDISFSGTVTNADAGTAVLADAPLQLLQSVNLQANGSKNLCNSSGVAIYGKNVHQNKGRGPKLTPPSAFAAAAYSVAGSIRIDQSMIDGINPKDSQFPSNNLSSLKLQIQIGNAKDLFAGVDASTLSAATLTVTAVQVREYAGADKKRARPDAVQYVNEIVLAIPSSQSNMQQILLTDTLHRALFFRTEINGAASDAVLNSIRLERANQTLATISGPEMKRLMVDIYTEDVKTGYYALDPARAIGNSLAKLTDGYNMRPEKGAVAEQLYLYLDVNGGAGYEISIMQNYFEDYGRFIGA